MARQDGVERAAAAGVANAHGPDLGPGRHAHDPLSVVYGCDGAGDVRPVTVIVDG